jgi:hypothetical protein
MASTEFSSHNLEGKIIKVSSVLHEIILISHRYRFLSVVEKVDGGINHRLYTDKKEYEIFLLYEEIQMDRLQSHIYGRASKYMRKFPYIYMRKI